MGIIDFDRIAQEISPAAPSGEKDLVHDPAFMELEKNIKPIPAVEVEGRVVKEAKEPDWLKIQESALDLLTRAHDLRVVTSLIQALLHTEGLPGLSEGLTLLACLVKGYWDTLYPKLDPDDNNDPTERINILEALNDWNTVVAPLMRVTLCASRTVGSFNLRQYRIAKGRLSELAVSKEEEKEAPSLGTIEAAFRETDLKRLQADREAVSASLESLACLAMLLSERAGQERAPDFHTLCNVLKEINDLLSDQLSMRAPAEVSTAVHMIETEDSARADGAQLDEVSALRGDWTMVEVRSRKDVLRLLEQICTYYERNEPASPVPLLLKRATRLVEKNFMEIMEDLAPESVAQIRILSGVKEDKQ
ncbi:MAG: type VI secretion system protein TssA [Desulforhabdus sp.]|nr:type VI secretion system protein TssA [Desulforhabdus sp.]